MTPRQIRAIKLSLTNFRLATICVDAASKFPVLILDFTPSMTLIWHSIK
ncbi:hypothetical protein [Nostoc sp.]